MEVESARTFVAPSGGPQFLRQAERQYTQPNSTVGWLSWVTQWVSWMRGRRFPQESVNLDHQSPATSSWRGSLCVWVGTQSLCHPTNLAWGRGWRHTAQPAPSSTLWLWFPAFSQNTTFPQCVHCTLINKKEDHPPSISFLKVLDKTFYQHALNPHRNPTRKILLSPLCRWGSWGSKKLNSFH